jgi:hypothetical protein
VPPLQDTIHGAVDTHKSGINREEKAGGSSLSATFQWLSRHPGFQKDTFQIFVQGSSYILPQ